MRYRETAIRKLAYELWEQAGRPEGRSDEFWFAARFKSELHGGDRSDTAGRAYPTDAPRRFVMN